MDEENTGLDSEEEEEESSISSTSSSSSNNHEKKNIVTFHKTDENDNKITYTGNIDYFSAAGPFFKGMLLGKFEERTLLKTKSIGIANLTLESLTTWSIVLTEIEKWGKKIFLGHPIDKEEEEEGLFEALSPRHWVDTLKMLDYFCFEKDHPLQKSLFKVAQRFLEKFPEDFHYEVNDLGGIYYFCLKFERSPLSVWKKGATINPFYIQAGLDLWQQKNLNVEHIVDLQAVLYCWSTPFISQKETAPVFKPLSTPSTRRMINELKKIGQGIITHSDFPWSQGVILAGGVLPF